MAFADRYSAESALNADLLTIDTPEQVALRFPVAGVGSRFLALFTDCVVQAVVYLIIVLVFVLLVSAAPKTPAGQMSHSGEKWLIAILILIHFLMYWGYFALFEAFWNGQTPGKRLCKLRVIQDSGRQITFFESMTRNLIRIVDMLPGMYLVGVVAMVSNRQHKRLGDMAAGTLVVHERRTEEPIWGGTGSRTLTASLFTPPTETTSFAPPEAEFPADAVARLSSDDLLVMERFFARILDMDLETRAGIADKLARQMTAKMGITLEPDAKPERLLEGLVRQMRSVGR
ncbi:RDD family protein [Silvibacterium dinghuense]|uniref:RDD family protein n=1 Tax=Silvibacterium dinghuense TaxID=1560006 RepID=A0A4Q1SGR9_9BACT|nr:RDD family protein [Silvibacterium dinghuense]RXS96716.1 RDD family protein [Silvibacterium dinghuense]GGG93073.1 transporter [Silvibacterium dinghuense]